MGQCHDRCSNVDTSYCGGCNSFQDCEQCYKYTGGDCDFDSVPRYNCKDNSSRVSALVIPILLVFLIICIVLCIRRQRQQRRLLGLMNPGSAYAPGSVACPRCASVLLPPPGQSQFSCPNCQQVLLAPSPVPVVTQAVALPMDPSPQQQNTTSTS